MPGGAKTRAVLYGLIETAKESGLDPDRHLTWVMTTAPAMDLADPAQGGEPAPENAPVLCRTWRS